MRKKVLLGSLLFVFAILLVACDKTVELTAITFSGTDDVTVDFNETFNVLEGVTAIGNDGVDYSSSITYLSTSDITDDLLDTTATGDHAIQYNVTVGEVLAQTWRYVTVNEPEAVEGQMLVNSDLSSGTAGWDSDSVVYQADGGTIVLTNDEGTLKAEIVSGSNSYTPRFGQMGVPFENDTTYEISFDAKSSVEKIINLQVGELLDSDPYFTDFKTGVTIHKTITTEWANYSYKFTMNQAETNHRGGILFEVGTVEALDVDATMWFDNITIEVATADPDETAPVFAGVNETKQIFVDSVYDPMDGVSAYDALDGDVTADITYVVKDEAEAVVETLSTSAVGVFTITYTVEDEAGNIATEVTTLSIVEAPQDTYALPEWRTFVNTWDGSDVSLYGMNGQMVLMVNNANFYEGWHLQIIQDAYSLGGETDNEGSMMLVAGQSYRVTFDAKSSIAGDFALQIGSSLPSWVAYHSETLSVTTEMQTFTVDFTLDESGDFSSAAQ
ncbi:MAG: carbohydrate binding domain-containing protein, partial [Acholeplasmataceae bacterium]